MSCGQGEQKSYQLPPDLRQPESHVPPRAGAAPAGARRARYGSRRPDRRFGVVLTRCPCFLPPTPSTRRGTGRSPRREDAIENALKAKLQARAAQRRAQEMMARQAAKELEEFTNEFKNAARHCFELIDVDKGGSLSKEEIVNARPPLSRLGRAIDVARKRSVNAVHRRLGSMPFNRVPFNLRGLQGTAVFVCLVCGGEEQLNTAFRAVALTCGPIFAAPRCRRPWRSWTRTRAARSTPTSGGVARRPPSGFISPSDVVSRAGRRPSTGASRSASSSSRPSRSGGRGPRPRPTANSPRSSSTRPASASGSSTGTGAGRSRRREEIVRRRARDKVANATSSTARISTAATRISSTCWSRRASRPRDHPTCSTRTATGALMKIEW